MYFTYLYAPLRRPKKNGPIHLHDLLCLFIWNKHAFQVKYFRKIDSILEFHEEKIYFYASVKHDFIISLLERTDIIWTKAGKTDSSWISWSEISARVANRNRWMWGIIKDEKENSSRSCVAQETYCIVDLVSAESVEERSVGKCPWLAKRE